MRNKKIIDISNIKNLPSELTAALCKYLSPFCEATNKCSTTNLPHNRVNYYKHSFYPLLDDYYIKCYHGSRITDIKYLMQYGLVDDWCVLNEILTEFLSSKCEDDSLVEMGISAIKREYERKHHNSTAKICFTFNKSLFSEDYAVFTETIGGETVLWALEDKNEFPYSYLLSLLQNNGTPVIVEFVISFSQFSEQIKERIFDAFVTALLNKFQNNDGENIIADGYYEGSILPNQIIQIMKL